MWNILWNNLTPQSEAFATWIAAIATLFLVGGIWLTVLSMRVSARASAFQLTYGRFNAQNMLYARAVFAKTHLDRKANNRIKDNFLPSTGWLIVGFLNQVGRLVQDKKLNLKDVMLAYSDYVTVIGMHWGSRISDDEHKSRYSGFLNLYKKIEELRSSELFKNELDAYYDEAFWECEASLDTAAKSEG